MLQEFIVSHYAEILAETRRRATARGAPYAMDAELPSGLLLFLDQLGGALRRAASHAPAADGEIERGAGRHGGDLFAKGASVAHVVHDYGDLCQVMTGLAIDHSVVIAADEFQTLNVCLDEAIAGALTEHARLRELSLAGEGTERLGLLAHEMRNLLSVAILSFGRIQKGTVSSNGSTGAMHARSLVGLSRLIDRSLADVRLEAGLQNVGRISVRDVLEEVVIGVSMVALDRGLRLDVSSVDATAVVDADRQILAAAVANLVQNALKFTQQDTTVRLRAHCTASRVLIEVEDECGGLPAGDAAELLRPFTQRGRDRTGLGLGLSICAKAATSMGGELRLQDLPSRGCLFTMDLPKPPRVTLLFASPPPSGVEEDSPATRRG